MRPFAPVMAKVGKRTRRLNKLDSVNKLNDRWEYIKLRANLPNLILNYFVKLTLYI